mmetsp:Transcript_80214/g.180990  ORF Transcript_80214/g.180990 Transcript_80214/m.180990 type:complete len:223 (+) Transcript_80214:621-1289(+)
MRSWPVRAFSPQGSPPISLAVPCTARATPPSRRRASSRVRRGAFTPLCAVPCFKLCHLPKSAPMTLGPFSTAWRPSASKLLSCMRRKRSCWPVTRRGRWMNRPTSSGRITPRLRRPCPRRPDLADLADAVPQSSSRAASSRAHVREVSERSREVSPRRRAKRSGPLPELPGPLIRQENAPWFSSQGLRDGFRIACVRQPRCDTTLTSVVTCHHCSTQRSHVL